MRRYIGWGVAIGALIISLFTNVFFFQKIQALEEPYTVIKVIDGDTIVLKSDQSIRLGNMEAPEPENCYGQRAKKRLEELVLGQTVRLEIFTFDRFKRPVALVYTGNTLVNETMLGEGLARYEGTPSSKRTELKKAFDSARDGKKGLFGKCVGKTPDRQDCVIKGNIDRHYKVKTYHFPGCSEYQSVTVEKDLGEKWFCTETDAVKAGYTKAKNCFGKIYKTK